MYVLSFMSLQSLQSVIVPVEPDEKCNDPVVTAVVTPGTDNVI